MMKTSQLVLAGIAGLLISCNSNDGAPAAPLTQAGEKATAEQTMQGLVKTHDGMVESINKKGVPSASWTAQELTKFDSSLITLQVNEAAILKLQAEEPTADIEMVVDNSLQILAGRIAVDNARQVVNKDKINSSDFEKTSAKLITLKTQGRGVEAIIAKVEAAAKMVSAQVTEENTVEAVVGTMNGVQQDEMSQLLQAGMDLVENVYTQNLADQVEALEALQKTLPEEKKSLYDGLFAELKAKTDKVAAQVIDMAAVLVAITATPSAADSDSKFSERMALEVNGSLKMMEAFGFDNAYESVQKAADLATEKGQEKMASWPAEESK
ncbi:MAG: hypothetical protein AAF203_08710 [Pseudomonadota bacterium]